MGCGCLGLVAVLFLLGAISTCSMNRRIEALETPVDARELRYMGRPSAVYAGPSDSADTLSLAHPDSAWFGRVEDGWRAVYPGRTDESASTYLKAATKLATTRSDADSLYFEFALDTAWILIGNRMPRAATLFLRPVPSTHRRRSEADHLIEIAEIQSSPVRYVHGVTNVRAGPGTSQRAVGQLSARDMVRVQPIGSGQWSRVFRLTIENGEAEEFHADTLGYVYSSLLKLSRDPPRVQAPARSSSARSSRRPRSSSARPSRGSGKKGSWSTAWVACKDAVRQRLQSPRSADFPWSSRSAVQEGEHGEWVVSSYVDARNPMGVEIRTYFICEATFGRDDIMPDRVRVQFIG